MADLAASITQRLRNYATTNQQDFNSVLTRYGLERLLFRLSKSKHADSFLLKGALLFLLWHDLPNRPTRDIDLLGFGPDDLESVATVFKDVCLVDGADAVRFDPSSIKTQVIRKDAGYGGVRITLVGKIRNIQLPIQIDVGFGDAVTPEATVAEFPVILTNLPVPVLKVYPKFTVCAEKFHAISSLGMANTRLKDFYDIWLLLELDALDAETLGEAIAATFRRRGTRIADDWPLGLTDEFSSDEPKQRQWNAFLSKNRLEAPDLPDLVGSLRDHLSASVNQARSRLA